MRITNAPYLGRYNNDDLKEYETEHLIAELHRRRLSLEDIEPNFRTLEFTQSGYSEREQNV